MGVNTNSNIVRDRKMVQVLEVLCGIDDAFHSGIPSDPHGARVTGSARAHPVGRWKISEQVTGRVGTISSA